MYVRRNIRPGLILQFAWRNLIVFTLWSGWITALYCYLRPRGINISLPFLPLSTIGIAVAFYMGFKNNQSYDRFWEGRKTWGGIVNNSRTWASQVLSYVGSHPGQAAPPAPAELRERHRALVYRQLAWVNALRLQLRRTTIHDRHNLTYTPHVELPDGGPGEPQVATFLQADECRTIMTQASPPAQLLHRQSQALQELFEAGLIDSFRHMDLMQTLRECYNLQGACERIKNTPFPRQYAYFSTLFVCIFILLLPFGLLGEFSKLGDGSSAWLAIPFSVLISWIFITIETVGDNSEDPFENYVNDVPMTAICRNIEIDLRQMLGETDLPPRLQPVNDILL